MNLKLRRSGMFIETAQIHDPSSVGATCGEIMADVHLHVLLFRSSSAHAAPTELIGLSDCLYL